jgi:tetratricopeptide (TPR) repeat protein
LAAVVSTGALAAAAGSDRRSLGLATSPFGWNRLIVIHTLSTLMISLGVARLLGQLIADLRERWFALVWVLVGVAVAWMTGLAGVVVEALLDSSQAGYGVRLACRTVWCVVLQVPWCMAGIAAMKKPRPPALFPLGHLMALGALSAVGIPASFTAVFLEQQTQSALAKWQQDQLYEARLLVQRLNDVGSTLGLGQRPQGTGAASLAQQVTPQAALRDLQNALVFRANQIDTLKATNRGENESMQLARFYLSLDQTDKAEATLRPLANAHALAAIQLAGICRETDRPEESRKWAEKALQLAQKAEPAGQDEVALNENIQMQAYDLLAVFAGEASDFVAAEKYLREAWERLPARRADIHHRLGKHYEFIGELAKAVKHQQEAARLEPNRYPPPSSVVRKMLSTGAPVGLARPKSSRYKH